MKRLFYVLASILLAATAAHALSQSSIPPKFGVAWGNNAGAAYIRSIPPTSQIGVQNCAASLPDGFPPLTFVPGNAGGCPPFGQDFNGILKQLSQWNQWQAAGGPVFYDSAFATSVGGYPNGAVLSSSVTPGTRWMSTADNNTTNPDAGGAGWVQDPGQIPIGTPVQSLSTVIQSGYVSANGTTIGDALSNGTGRANADTQFLFAFVWAACPNTQCPIFTSAGAVSTRGANAAADYAAHKALATQNLNGTGLMGADSQNGTTSTNLVNVPVTSGSRTVPGSILGENLHVLTIGELATVTPSGTIANGTITTTVPMFGITISSGTLNTSGGSLNPSTPITLTQGTSTFTGTPFGSNTPHNNVERSAVVYWNLKL